MLDPVQCLERINNPTLSPQARSRPTPSPKSITPRDATHPSPQVQHYQFPVIFGINPRLVPHPLRRAIAQIITPTFSHSPGYPIELFPGYTNPEGLSVNLSVFADDVAEVRTQRGELYMAMRGKRRKTLYDCYGFPIVNIRRKGGLLLGEYEVRPSIQIPAPNPGKTHFPQVFDGEGSSDLLLTISARLSWGGSKMTASMTNWNKEHIQLRVKGNLTDRHGKVMFDDIEVGRIHAAGPKNTKSTTESYIISTAAYGTQLSPPPSTPPSRR